MPERGVATDRAFPCQIELDEYEVANLREGLLTLRALNCDTGDWLGQILQKLPETEYGANVPVDDQIAHRVIHSPAVLEAQSARREPRARRWILRMVLGSAAVVGLLTLVDVGFRYWTSAAVDGSACLGLVGAWLLLRWRVAKRGR